MKIAAAMMFAWAGLAAGQASAQGFKPSTGTFGSYQQPAPATSFIRAPSLAPDLYAPPSRRSSSLSSPTPGLFKPYGDRSGMNGGGPGAYPSAPRPRGYIDIYGNKKSEHPFAY